MKLNDLLLSEFDREVARSRKALKQMPDGKKDWKPHDKSMQFGYLGKMVATIPIWIALMISRDDPISRRKRVHRSNGKR